MTAAASRAIPVPTLGSAELRAAVRVAPTGPGAGGDPAVAAAAAEPGGCPAAEVLALTCRAARAPPVRDPGDVAAVPAPPGRAVGAAAPGLG
jgi:hypothetical protein